MALKNDEARMTKDEGSPKSQFQTGPRAKAIGFGFCHSDFFRHSTFVILHGYSRLLLIHDPHDHPSRRASIISHRFPCRLAIGGKNDALMHARTMGINGHLRSAFRSTGLADRLADYQSPTLKARVLPSGR
jgi:hypothetical protein